LSTNQPHHFVELHEMVFFYARNILNTIICTTFAQIQKCICAQSRQGAFQHLLGTVAWLCTETEAYTLRQKS